MDMLVFLYLLVSVVWGSIDWYVANPRPTGKWEVAKMYLLALLWPWRVVVAVYNRVKAVPPGV